MKNHHFCRTGMFRSNGSYFFPYFCLLFLFGIALETRADQLRGDYSGSRALEDGSGPSATTLISTARTFSAGIDDFRDSRTLWRALDVEEEFHDSAVTKTLGLQDVGFELTLRCAQARQLSCQISLALRPDSIDIIAPESGTASRSFRLSHVASMGLFESLSLPVVHSLDRGSGISWERKSYVTHDQVLSLECRRSRQGEEVLGHSCSVRVTWVN